MWLNRKFPAMELYLMAQTGWIGLHFWSSGHRQFIQIRGDTLTHISDRQKRLRISSVTEHCVRFRKTMFACRETGTIKLVQIDIRDQGRRSGYESGGTAYMSTQREVLEGQTGSHRAKRANFGRGVRGSSPEKFEKPTWQMVQSTLFLSYICEYF